MVWNSTARKIVVTLLALIFVAVSAACSSPNNAGNAGGASESPASPAAGNSDSSGQPAAEPPVEVFVLTKIEAGSEMPDDQLVIDYVARETNVIPNMIKPPAGTYDEKLNIMLASGEPLDAFIVNDWTEFQKRDMIMPLNDLLKDAPELVAAFNQDEWDSVTDSKTGEIYAIPFANTNLGNAPRVRTDWLDVVGLPVPETLEQFEAVLEAFKTSDKLGNNVIPLATHLSFSQLDRAFLGMWTEHGDLNWIDEEGNVNPAILDPGYKDFIAKIAEWYAKGYIWKEAFSQEFTVINDLVSQNRVGVLATWISVGLAGIEALETADPKQKHVYLTTLTGPKGSAYSLRLPPRQGVAISVNSRNPEATIQFFNWGVSNRQNRNIVSIGLESTHWNWVDETQGIIEIVPGSETRYSKILGLVLGGGSSNLTSSDDSVNSRLWNEFTEFQRSPDLVLKKPADYGVPYDEAKIAGTVPSVSDIEKFRDKELVKFIMGQTPMDQWDEFIDNLLNLGLDDMIAERTAQYNAQQP